MNKSTVLMTLGALLLAGCASYCPCVGPIQSFLTFKDGQIGKVKIIYVPADRREATIEWQLPEGKGVKFAEEGIVVEGEVVFPVEAVPEQKGRPSGSAPLRVNPAQKSNFVCSRLTNPLKASCTSNGLVVGIYKYSIKIQLQGQKEPQVLVVDPPFVIMCPPDTPDCKATTS